MLSRAILLMSLDIHQYNHYQLSTMQSEEKESNEFIYISSIVEYVKRFETIKLDNRNIKKLESIQNFRNFISNDSVLNWQFQAALNQIPEKVTSAYIQGERDGILYKHTVDEALDMLNIAVQTPPCFWPSQLCGVPIYSILSDLVGTKYGSDIFSRPDVNQHLKNILNDYGQMLKTEKSLRYMNTEKGGWLSEQASKFINYNDYVCDKTKPHYGFKCWNDWFIRELAQGARPIEGKDDPSVIIHSSENYPITTLSVHLTKVKATDQFWLKQNRYSLYDMFSAKKMGVKEIIDESFVGGTVYQGYLSPWCYHRWHSPVTGVIQKAYKIDGCFFLENPDFDKNDIHFYAHSQVFLSCTATRYIFIINTNNESIGRVALMEIGMVQVSSCVPMVKEGDHISKGQCIGRFEFGGSSQLILFDKKANLEFNPAIYEREKHYGFEYSKLQKVNSWLAKIKN